MFSLKKKSQKERFDNLAEDFWELHHKFEMVCKLLGIGFYGDSDYPDACFIDKSKTLTEKLK